MIKLAQMPLQLTFGPNLPLHMYTLAYIWQIILQYSCKDITRHICSNGSRMSLQKINCQNALEMEEEEGSPSTEKTQKDESTSEVINHL